MGFLARLSRVVPLIAALAAVALVVYVVVSAVRDSTRAKEVLKISYVTVKNGKEAQPSRFVEELHPKKKETQGGTNKSGFY